MAKVSDAQLMAAFRQMEAVAKVARFLGRRDVVRHAEDIMDDIAWKLFAREMLGVC